MNFIAGIGFYTRRKRHLPGVSVQFSQKRALTAQASIDDSFKRDAVLFQNMWLC